ncbi:histidine phosphatase family protein [Sporosarcina sp. YIM B06819]|uniref:histidine phosphatase family protein n=1 Tax=Sporosarcina sp. YIM B06819 TaxID=3081769 RepID=UPI00298BF051|nr:histidine phosphatase family protein [Sporosarcina sp. YIM B06819]
MDDRFVLHVIRHLPTAGNEQRKYIGWTDEPILETGARCLVPAQVVVGSDLLRAKQTAALYYPEVAYEADPNWRECHFGDFEGKTYADLEKDIDYRRWIDDPYSYAPRGGESLVALEQRVLSALKQVPNGAVIVTHGGPIRLLLTKFSPVDKGFWSWSIPHGKGYRLEWASEQAFKEGNSCISLLAVPITANETT